MVSALACTGKALPSITRQSNSESNRFRIKSLPLCFEMCTYANWKFFREKCLKSIDNSYRILYNDTEYRLTRKFAKVHFYKLFAHFFPSSNFLAFE